MIGRFGCYKKVDTIISNDVLIIFIESLLSHECLNIDTNQYYISKHKNKIYLQKLILN